MPNHYTNAVVAIDATEDGALLQNVAEWLDANPCPIHLVVPMPKELEGTTSPRRAPSPDPVLVAKYGFDNWYDWQRANWGIKWGAYDVQPPVLLPGEAGAVMVSFVTAWGAPNEHVRGLIAQALQTLGAGRVTWLGVDPANDTFAVLGEWEPSATYSPNTGREG